jgi:hypothetical protein
MMRRAFIRLIGAFAVCWPLFGHVQQQNPPVRKQLSWLSGTDCQIFADNTFDRRFREPGWIRGKTSIRYAYQRRVA